MMMVMMIKNCFVVWLTDERCLAIFQAGIIVRDPHHRESSRISDILRVAFVPVQNLSSGLVELSSAVVTATTPRRYTEVLHRALRIFPSFAKLYVLQMKLFA